MWRRTYYCNIFCAWANYNLDSSLFIKWAQYYIILHRLHQYSRFSCALISVGRKKHYTNAIIINISSVNWEHNPSKRET